MLTDPPYLTDSAAVPIRGGGVGERILESGTGKAAHPCQKPIAVIQPFIARLCDSSHLVLDPFAGTGSSLYAAKACGLSAIGIEIEEKYCEIAARRLAQEVLSFGEAV